MIQAIQAIAAPIVTNLLDNVHHHGAPSNGVGFADMLAQMASSAIDTVKGAENLSIRQLSGEDIGIREVVDQVMAAEQSLNTAIAIRDKVVQAYLEISHMQI